MPRVVRRKARLLLAIGFFVLTALLALTVCGPVMLDRILTNVGMIRLNRGLATGVPFSPMLTRAEDTLARAVQLRGANHTGWRALGFTLAAQGREEEAIAAWQNADQMAVELALWGHQARQESQYEHAKLWYERASFLAPDNRALFYYRGLMHQRLEEPKRAARLYQRGLTKAPIEEIGTSDFYLRLGELAAQAVPPEWTDALENYRMALALGDFVELHGVSGAYYQAGLALHALGRVEESRAAFMEAVANWPENYWAHVQLGRLAWKADRDLDQAEAHLYHALTLNSELKWAYRALGEAYREAARPDDAASMYREVLGRDPVDPVAKQGLSQLNIESGRSE